MARGMRKIPTLPSLSWRPNREWLRRPFVSKTLVALGMILVGAAAFALGRSIGLGSIEAQVPAIKPAPIAPSVTDMNHLYGGDYSGRVVAYIFGNVPVTRTELAEHLIARYGSERLEFLVNRKIVEKVCGEKGIYVTDLEVEQQFLRDLKALGPNMTPKLFQEQVLKRYNKTIFEWKEDVIRPKLSLEKLVRGGPEAMVTDHDIIKGFEGRHGPKVLCRMVIYQNQDLARRGWEKIRSAPTVEAGFMAEARAQFVPQMASTGGEIPPIHKHFGSLEIEKEAFSLKPGEISRVLGMPDNTSIILFCVQHLPPDTTKTIEGERAGLLKEITEIKVAQAIQQKMQQLRKDADPRFLLARQPSMEQIQRDTEAELNGGLNFRPLEGK